MIIYNFKEELRMIIYLICYGIGIVGMYDIIVLSTKKQIFKYILQLIYTITTIIYTYYFAYKLNNGYIPQYALFIIGLGMFIYFSLLKEKTTKIKYYLSIISIKSLRIIKKILRPFRIFKLTAFEFFHRKKKNNNQNTLQK